MKTIEKKMIEQYLSLPTIEDLCRAAYGSNAVISKEQLNELQEILDWLEKGEDRG